jgi:hypothetical protein
MERSDQKNENVLHDLEIIEEDTLKIMEIAVGNDIPPQYFSTFLVKLFIDNHYNTETLRELQNAPVCDTTRLTALSDMYADLVRSVHERLSVHGASLTSSKLSADCGSYALIKEEEIFGAIRSLQEAPAEAPMES